MKKLIRCVFCNQVISIEELGYKDEEGYWCKRDWEWMQSFLKLWRDSHA